MYSVQGLRNAKSERFCGVLPWMAGADITGSFTLGEMNFTYRTAGYGHYRVDHSKDEFTRGKIHINGSEGLWGMAKFKRLPKHTFHLHLKETKWQYNLNHDPVKYTDLVQPVVSAAKIHYQ